MNRLSLLDPVVQFSVTPQKRVTTEETRGCSSAGRAPALQAGGHGFDSHHLHQKRIGKVRPGDEDHLDCRSNNGL